MSSQSTSNTGSVGSLWRYAVKSMRGEELDEALMNEGGIFGDRAYAVIDPSNGRVASAKLPRKWSKLVDLSARLVEPRRSGDQVPPVRITWPDGASVTSNDEDAGALLSEHLGRPVVLTTSRPESASVERLDPFETDESVSDIGQHMMKGKFSDYAAVLSPDPGILDEALLGRTASVGIAQRGVGSVIHRRMVGQGGTVRRGDPVRVE